MGCATSPHPDSLECMNKRHTHRLLIFNFLWTQLLGATIFCLWKCALIYILISAPPTCPKLKVVHIHLVPAKHPWPPTYRSSLYGHVIMRSHKAGQLFFIRCLTILCLSSLTSLCLPPGTQKSHLSLPPSNWPMAFFTDRSRTNWGTGPQHQNCSYRHSFNLYS